MTAEEIVNENFKGLDSLINDKDLCQWDKDLIKTCLENYHKSRLKEIMPMDEEIQKEFSYVSEIRLNDEDGRMERERKIGAIIGTKWLKSEIEKRNK